MPPKGSKANAPSAPSRDEKLTAIHKDIQKYLALLVKALTKKLKLRPQATEAIVLALIEAQLVAQFQESNILPARSKIGPNAISALLVSANSANFSKEAAENLLAFACTASAADLSTYTTPCGRLVYLEGLANTMADNFLYTQCTSFKYSTGLKRAGELLAKEVGGAFAKAWKPKSAASIASKLYCRRGRTVAGWLTDALQGRIICETQEGVKQAAAYFQQVLDSQTAAVKADGRLVLGEIPSGDRIIRYTTDGLLHSHTKKPVDVLAEYLSEMTDEDRESIGHAKFVVYRVQPCRCCEENEVLEPGEVILVNLMLMRTCCEASGFVYRLPEQRLACTMELQLGTADAFKLMKKSAEAHDRTHFFQHFPLLDKLQALANGLEGKLALPGAGKGGANKGGDMACGKQMLDLFGSADLMHPEPANAETVNFEGTFPTPEGFEKHTRDRAMPGSRWFRVWQSAGPIFRVDSVTFRLGGKPPPLGRFSFILSGVGPSGRIDRLAEEQLLKLPIIKGEVHFVADGLSPVGQMLGNLSGYSRVMLEYFEYERSTQWVDVTDIKIVVVAQGPMLALSKDGAKADGSNSRDEDVQAAAVGQSRDGG